MLLKNGVEKKNIVIHLKLFTSENRTEAFFGTPTLDFCSTEVFLFGEALTCEMH